MIKEIDKLFDTGPSEQNPCFLDILVGSEVAGQLSEENELNTGTHVNYSCLSTSGKFYCLSYNGTTEVLKMSRNIAKNESELKALEEAIKDPNQRSITLTVNPAEKQIELGRVTRIEYID